MTFRVVPGILEETDLDRSSFNPFALKWLEGATELMGADDANDQGRAWRLEGTLGPGGELGEIVEEGGFCVRLPQRALGGKAHFGE